MPLLLLFEFRTPSRIYVEEMPDVIQAEVVDAEECKPPCRSVHDLFRSVTKVRKKWFRPYTTLHLEGCRYITETFD